MVIPSLFIGALFAWNVFNFQTLTLCSTLVIAVTYLGSTVAAILLPFIKKDLYAASPIAKYKILGIPLISIAGVIFGGFLCFLLYQWIIDPNELVRDRAEEHEFGHLHGGHVPAGAGDLHRLQDLP